MAAILAGYGRRPRLAGKPGTMRHIDLALPASRGSTPARHFAFPANEIPVTLWARLAGKAPVIFRTDRALPGRARPFSKPITPCRQDDERWAHGLDPAGKKLEGRAIGGKRGGECEAL